MKTQIRKIIRIILLFGILIIMGLRHGPEIGILTGIFVALVMIYEEMP